MLKDVPQLVVKHSKSCLAKTLPHLVKIGPEGPQKPEQLLLHIPVKDQVIDNPMEAPLQVSSARSEQGLLPPPPAPPILLGSRPGSLCLHFSSIWRLQIEIISSKLCQPVLSLAPSPSTSQ